MESSSGSDAVRVDGLGYRLPGGGRDLLADVRLRLRPGECGLLTGPTGSGKSTLLRAIAGVAPVGGRLAGRIETRRRPVLLLQDVETQLLFTRVEEEVASGLRGGTAGLSGDAAARRGRVRELLAQVGLDGFEGRNVDDLSAGEKQRVSLAALLARDPTVLLLDEPTSALDASGRGHLLALLRSLKASGHSLLVAEHAIGPFLDLADRHFRMKEGRLEECAVSRDLDFAAPPRTRAPDATAGTCIRCTELEVRGADGRALVARLSLEVRRGERVLVHGANGSGKTSLLRALSGLVPATSGSLALDLDRDAGAPGAIGLLFQQPHRNLFERSVADELAFSLRRRGVPGDACRRRVEATLALCGLGPLRDRSPLRLSFGEQHRVALASILAPEPALLLLDEPFSGLDRDSRESLLQILSREQQRTGATVIVASHDREPLARWAHRCIELAGEDPCRV